jgi:hypothetical protein
MKVKIKDNIFDSDSEPILLSFTNQQLENLVSNLSAMIEENSDKTKRRSFLSYTDKLVGTSEIEEFWESRKQIS